MWSTLFAMFVTAVGLCHCPQIRILYVQHVGCMWANSTEIQVLSGLRSIATSKEVT